MAATPVKNLQDPRVKRTRQLLAQGLYSLVSEKGFEAITVQDIAKRATVNRATFYAHYEDKYDLVDRLFREHFQQRLADSVPSPSSVTASALESLCRTVFDFMAQECGHCQVDRQLAALLEGAMHDVLTEFIADWLRQDSLGIQLRSQNLAITAQTASSAFIGPGLGWIRGGRTQEAADLARQVVGVLAPGVLAAHRIQNWLNPPKGNCLQLHHDSRWSRP